MKGNESTNSVHAIVITEAERQFIHRTIVEERLFKFNLYNRHFNMDTIFKSLEGISRVLLAANFKNLLKETGSFVMFNNFKK